MQSLQIREKEIFETLKKIQKFDVVIIGGYATNCYVLPRVSVDCDLVVLNKKEAISLGKVLEKNGYIQKESDRIKIVYRGEFMSYEKEIKKDFKVNVDLLVGCVLDRQTNATFSAEWIFENSEPRVLKGKTIIEQLKLRIINPDALFAMKFITGRVSDMRDIFMLASKVENFEWVKEEISKRYNFK